MPNKASAAKRARQNLKRRARNRMARATMKTAMKQARESLEKKENIGESIKKAQSVVGHMVKRGIVHHRRAARMTSRLMRKAHLAAAGAPDKQT